MSIIHTPWYPNLPVEIDDQELEQPKLSEFNFISVSVIFEDKIESQVMEFE